jgi:hypothetical protein
MRRITLHCSHVAVARSVATDWRPVATGIGGSGN